MKILMLGWELPPHNSGGLGVACYHMCKSLAERGVGIQFILPYSAEHAIDFMDITAAHPQDVLAVLKAGNAYQSHRYLHIKSNGPNESLNLFEQQALYEYNIEQLVDVSEFDIIHAHDWLTFRGAMAAKRKTGKPLIVHIHATEHDRAAGNGGNELVRDIEYQAMMMADRVIAVSQATKDIIVEQYRIPANKITVVHNSVALDDAPPGGVNVYHYLEVMRQRGYKVVMNLGRLTIQKGLSHLLEAFKIVLEHQPKTYLLLVGSGEQYEELIELSAELGISGQVLFAGFQRGKAWSDAYCVADLFVMPSVSEPFGLSPLEAISHGTPALVSKQSGVAEAIRHMLVTDYWDAAMMADQMVAALRSDGLRQTLVDESSRELSRLSWSQSAEHINHVYEQELA